MKRRVAVVGTGVAGLEAAWIAGARGHHVTAFGRSAYPGGKTRLHAQLPGSEPLTRIYDYQLDAARKSGVRFELGVEASAADILALEAHAVVLAAGSRMLPPRGNPGRVRKIGVGPEFHRQARNSDLTPNFSEFPWPDLRTAMRDLLDKPAHRAGTAVIFDMDHTEGTYASAELLRTLFERVVVITPREYIAQKTALVTRQAITRRFFEKRIEVIPLAEPLWTESSVAKLTYTNVYSAETGVIPDIAFVAYSTPRVPENALAAPLRAAGIEVHLIGDCALPRGLLAATSEGHAAGNAV
jgi:hypothetical protein